MANPAIVVAVLTFRRPDDLTSALAELVDHVERSARADASILVVDNDDRPSAAPVVARFSGVRYVHEPQPGIAAARNRALAEAEHARLLVFIDDDERPQAGWLDRLVDTWERSGAEAVVGPVVSSFAVPPDPWIEAGRFFVRLRHPTGTQVTTAATNNLLLDLAAVRALGLRFDDRFGTSGGSDTLFTRTLVAAGGRIVWCDEAVVTDVVPPERATKEWVLRRARRIGNSNSRVWVVMAEPGARRTIVRLRLIGQGAVRIAAGATRAAFGAAAGKPVHHARGIRMLARGRGIVGGAVGSVVAEYGRDERQGVPS